MIPANKTESVRPAFYGALLFLAAAAVSTHTATAQQTPDLAGGQFTTGCGNATAAPIFNAALMNSGLYGENNLIVVSDPDIVLINNQWWMIFATGPTGVRAIQPFAAYLPPGASLSTTTTYPSDPNGWHLVGAQPNGQGQAYPVYGIPGTNGWDQLAAETPSVDVGPDGSVSIYYSGHNAGQTPFQIGLMTNFANGQATGDPNPVMGATLPWEYSAGLPALLEQSVRWIPALNKFIMYYTAGAWWASPAPDNAIAYAESTDGINWVNRQKLDFPVAYYNQDFLYNEQRHRFEMVISKDRTGVGGANPRDIVWREAATPATAQANWVNETSLLLYGGGTFFDSGVLSPSLKYGNLPGEENRLYVFFHSYDSAGNMQIGRFYCDAAPSPTPTFSLSQSNPAVAVVQNTGATMTFGVNAQSGFTGTVNFSVSGVPAGVNATLTQTSSTTGTSLSLFVQPTAVLGSYPIVVTGTSGSITQTSTFTLTVNGPANFSLTPSITNLSLAQGAGSTLSINVSPVYGFSGAVSFSASGFPATVNNSFLQTSSTTGTTLVVYVQPATAPGQYPITVTGTSGGLTRTTNFTLSVTGTATAQPQTITFNAIPAQTVGTTLMVSATASSNLPVTFSVVPNGNCSVSGNVVTFLNAGNCGVLANQAGNSAYLAAPQVGQIIVVNNPTPQTISFSAIPAQKVGTPLALSATASSGLAVSFASSPTSVCTVSGSTASFVAAGTCTIVASQAGNGTYSAASSVSQSFSVAASQQAQTITFNPIPAQTVGTTLTVSATASSNLPVTFSVVPNGNCSISGSTVTFLNAGNCGVIANQPGNASYLAAPAVGQIVVVNNLTPQTISFSAIPAQKVGTPLALSATASSGLAVSFASSPTSVCKVSGTTASFVAAGTCTIVASQAGNGTYSAAASVSRSFTVAPEAQTITFNAIPAQTVGHTLTLAATASSGLPISYVIVPNGDCSISGSTLTFLNQGLCGVVATQTGNSAYAQAVAVGQTITVN